MLSGLALAAGCSRGTTVRTVESSRVVESANSNIETTSTTAERFGMGAHGKSATVAPSETPASGLAWTTPAGWTELPASSMRIANFHPAGDERADCYLTMLSGDAGGLVANVNRWRAQLTLSGMSAEALDALPKVAMFGHDATLVDFTGTWKGMSGSEARDHWRLTGLVLCDPNGSAFLKMIGPDDVVAAQHDAFCALARSFRPAGTPASDASTSSSNASSASDSPSAGAGTTSKWGSTDAATTATTNGASASTTGAGTAPLVDGTPDNANGFSFKMPAGWHHAPDRPARAFTLFAGAGEGLECYVTTLTGDAGGPLANVNRWRGQLGLTGVTESDMAKMPRVQLLGGDAVLVECDGTSASLLAAARNSVERSWFVKMTGPRDLVRAQHAAFLAFCASLAEAR